MVNHPILICEENRRQAMLAGDASCLLNMFDDVFLYRHGSGDVDTAISYIEKISTGFVRYLKIDFSNIKILQPKNSSIYCVEGDMHSQILVNGALKDVANHYWANWYVSDETYKLFSIFNQQL